MKKVIVLGAGSAGLVTAILLKQTFPNYDVTVIESDSVGIIGVGESSTEHWRQFLEYTNININTLIRKTDATLKKGIKFDNWNGDGKYYFHSIDGNFYNYNDPVNIYYASRTLIANGIKTEDVLSDTNLIEYASVLFTTNQYQFNTFKLNEFLHEIGAERGINFVKATISDVKLSYNGDVDLLVSEDGIEYKADFYVDSSGFKRVISSKLGAKWVSYGKYLPMNHAIAFPTDDVSDLKPYTLARALENGWNWRIATQGRHGNGYVFCDQFIDSTKAYDEIQRHYKEEIVVAKDIKFEAGRIDKFWINNCVSVGLSSSFVEPLEASSIGNTILQGIGLCKLLSAWEIDRNVSKLYDREFIKAFDNIVDFVQLHYMTKRSDSKFWKALPSLMEKTDFVKEHLDLFKKTMPIHSVFEGEYLMFRSHNWAQVMAGLELYELNYIRSNLLNTIGQTGINKHLEDYEKYLSQIESNFYIDHATLLNQNRTIVTLNRS